MVGTWVVAQDGADKVIMVDGRPWVASKDNPTKLLIESARKLYGTQQRRADGQREAVRLLPGRRAARASTTSPTARSRMKFKTVAGDADRASGILFNVKPNGDWLAVRYNDTENNVGAVGVPQRHAPQHEIQRSRARSSCSIARRGTS